MSLKTQFEKQRPRLLTEAIIKSGLCGLCVGFGAGFLTAVLTWITPGLDFWMTFVALVLVGTLAAVVFYFKCFRPSDLSNARRIDGLGLEERLVTMVEYQNDDSCMAQMQRKDALSALASVDPKRIEYRVSTKIWISVVLTAVLGLGMMTVSVLGDLGLLPSALEIGDSIMNPEEPEIYLSVTYFVEEGGYIEGEADQLILKGGDASPVVAIAEDGYEFLYWDDGSDTPSRLDVQITEELILFAVFGPIEGEEGDDDDQDGMDMAGSDPYGDPGGNGPPAEGGIENPNDSQTGTGQYEEHNQIIDGETYYRIDIELYKQKVKEYLEEHGDELTDRQRAIIEAYIGIV